MNLKFFEKKYLKDNIYCFVATRSPEVISKIMISRKEWIKLRAESNFKIFLFLYHSSRKESGVISFSAINDIGDYDVSQISSKLMNGDFVRNYDGESLINLSCSNKKYFACMTDFWGVVTHYWFKSEDTFICSNNIFMVSALTGGELSKEGLYEYLFFLAPIKNKTWFENIMCLLPGQQLIFDIEKNSVKLSESTDFSILFEPHAYTLLGRVEKFFLKAKDKISSTAENNIALSAGSDSRTILACLKHFGMKPNAISFGRNDMVETQKINKLVDELNVPWRLVNLEGFENNFNDLFAEGTFISNGLLNPLRTHYVILYDQINEGNSLFEGILGSEFVKGEICPDAMISKLHKDVIVNGNSITETIEKYYPELSSELKESMSSYINSKYGTELVDINSSMGLKYFQKFLLEFVPSKVFGGIILLVLTNSISPYYPFLSPKVLRSIFREGLGICSNISLRRDFTGPIKCLIQEAEIVRAMDKQIFNSVLDRNISFKDVFYPLFLSNIKRKYYLVLDKIKNKKFIRGQIDIKQIQKIVEDITNSLNLEILPLKQKKKISNPLITKAIVNLASIIKLSAPQNLNHIELFERTKGV